MQEAREGQKKPPFGLAQPKQSQVHLGPWHTFERLRQCAETAALGLQLCESACL